MHHTSHAKVKQQLWVQQSYETWKKVSNKSLFMLVTGCADLVTIQLKITYSSTGSSSIQSNGTIACFSRITLSSRCNIVL